MLQKRLGVDILWRDDLHPENREYCVGKAGLDKTLTLVQIIEIAYSMKEKPNIIIKAGPNAKWYLKKCDPRLIDSEIERNANARCPTPEQTARRTMWIIEWD